MRNFQGIILNEHEHIGKFLNLYECTFKASQGNVRNTSATITFIV